MVNLKKHPPGKLPLTVLNDGPIRLICHYLTAAGLLSMSMVSIRLQMIADTERNWQRLCLAKWPSTERLTILNFKRYFGQRIGIVPASRGSLIDMTLLLGINTRTGRLCSEIVPLGAMFKISTK